MKIILISYLNENDWYLNENDWYLEERIDISMKMIDIKEMIDTYLNEIGRYLMLGILLYKFG